MTVANSDSGRTVKCYWCGEPFVAPRFSDPEPPDVVTAKAKTKPAKATEWDNPWSWDRGFDERNALRVVFRVAAFLAVVAMFLADQRAPIVLMLALIGLAVLYRDPRPTAPDDARPAPGPPHV